MSIPPDEQNTPFIQICSHAKASPLEIRKIALILKCITANTSRIVKFFVIFFSPLLFRNRVVFR